MAASAHGYPPPKHLQRRYRHVDFERSRLSPQCSGVVKPAFNDSGEAGIRVFERRHEDAFPPFHVFRAVGNSTGILRIPCIGQSSERSLNSRPTEGIALVWQLPDRIAIAADERENARFVLMI
jgi:hypothetical protein